MKKKPALFLSILFAAGIFSFIQSPILVHSASSLTISGSALFGGKIVQQTFAGTIIVQSPPPPSNDFSIDASPTAMTVYAGSSTVSFLRITSYANLTPYSCAPAIDLSLQPPTVNGLTASLNYSSVTICSLPNLPFADQKLTVTTLLTTPAGNYTFTLTGTSGTVVHIVPLSVLVIPAPVLTFTPAGGPAGTQIVVRGSGFRICCGPTDPSEILVTFDDQPVGSTRTSNGGFNFTFNVPVAKVGAHTIKATQTDPPGETSNTLWPTATTSFQVMSPTALSSQTSTAIELGALASIGAIGASLVCWRMGYFRRPSTNSQWT